jgi:hypothetical protein
MIYGKATVWLKDESSVTADIQIELTDVCGGFEAEIKVSGLDVSAASCLQDDIYAGALRAMNSLAYDTRRLIDFKIVIA